MRHRPFAASPVTRTNGGLENCTKSVPAGPVARSNSPVIGGWACPGVQVAWPCLTFHPGCVISARCHVPTLAHPAMRASTATAARCGAVAGREVRFQALLMGGDGIGGMRGLSSRGHGRNRLSVMRAPGKSAEGCGIRISGAPARMEDELVEPGTEVG